MAFDGFMTIKGPNGGAPAVVGETRDKQYANDKYFSIKSFSIDAENPHSLGTSGGGAGTSKAKLNPFKVGKWTDNCSPSLFKACCCGGHYNQAFIVVRKAGAKSKDGGQGLEYLKFEFRAVFVTNIEWSGESEDELPSENVTFTYGSMSITYTPQNPDGSPGTPNPQMWNQVTNDGDDMTVPGFTG
jgi:type VI secretion system secreted protein Hcp